jgi:N utilization substance protein B
MDVCKYASSVINSKKQKFLATETDLNPNLKFVNNKFFEQFKENEDFQRQVNGKKMSWGNYPELPKRIFTNLVQTEEYKTYMESGTSSYEEDKKIAAFMFESVIYDCDLFYQTLEQMSVYWVDTAEFVIGMVLKTIERYKLGYDGTYPLPRMFKNDDDREFVLKLFRKTISRDEYYRGLISENTQNWDIERIAFIDILILQTALAEVEAFPEIPLKVTFNEYIELAKNYSTNKSNIFVNGVLDKIVSKLMEEKKIKKIAEMPAEAAEI